jgi:glycosyltransferase involved in cell wall biosynthesis
LRAPFADRPNPMSLRHRLTEYAKYESRFCQELMGIGGLSAATALRMLGKNRRAIELETSVHRNALSTLAEPIIERRFRKSLRATPALEGFIEDLSPQRSTQVFFDDPERLLGQRILVIKSPRGAEKGVLLMDYSFVFPLLIRYFDLQAIARRYYLVTEPSWSGLCDREVMCVAGRGFPVFVQTNEPRDIAFLERLDLDTIPVPIAANWWVDTRVFHPLPGVTPDADLVMNSAWSGFKRHDEVFEALARLRARGIKLKTLLVGYAGDMTRADVESMARRHGVFDQLEILEKLRPHQVNEVMNRAKVNLIWSRREGSNRAIIEGFAAGVPGILREGFNFGHKYPYINRQTGVYASQATLPDAILAVIRDRASFDPRTWMVENMSPQIATREIDERIAAYAARKGEPWSRGELAQKVTSLHSMAYWDENERAKFAADYTYLKESRIR